MAELHPAQKATPPFKPGIPYERWRHNDITAQAVAWRENIPKEWLELHAQQTWIDSIATPRSNYGWRSA